MWTTEVAETARGPMPYLTHGDGEPVVCWHGFPDLPHTYGPVAERLASRGWKVIAPYLRGFHPDYQSPGAYYDAASRTADGQAFLEAVSPDAPVGVVGHDWGASLVYGLTAAHPELVTRAVTMALPPIAALASHVFDPVQMQRSFYIWFFQMPGLPEAILNTSHGGALFDHFWRTWSPRAAQAAHVPEVRAALGDTGVVVAALGYYRGLFQDAYMDAELSGLRELAAGPPRVPVLLLGGDEDGCLTAEALRDAAPFLHDGEVRIVEGTGHFLHLEEPDVVAEAIEGWLRRA